MTKRPLTFAAFAAVAIGVVAVAAPRFGHTDGDGHQHAGHRHVYLQEAGGKPMPLSAPQRRHLDSDNCPAGSVFNVVNRGSVPIVQVFLRPSATTGGFEEDKLRGRVLNPGQSLELDPGIGRYDVLVMRADGVGFTALRQNPCRISVVALRPDATVTVR